MRKYTLPALLLILTLLLYRAGPAITQLQVLHPLPSGLVFSTYYGSFTDDIDGLFYVDPHTMEMTVLLEHSVDRASWSPDGNQIAVVESEQRVCIYQLNGGELQCIGLEMSLWHQGVVVRFPITWSADGDNLLLLLGSPGNAQLGVLDVSRNNVIVTHDVPLDGETLEWIYWSPTGEYLAYQTFPGQRGYATRHEPSHLKLLNVQTGELRHVTDQSHDGCVAWAEDGDRIAVVSEEWEDPEFLVGLNGLITIYDINGDISDEVQPHYQDQDVSGCRIAWSHDGTRLAFFGYERNRYGSWDWQAFVTQIDSGETQRLLTPSYSYYPDTIEWSFDDTHLVVGARYADAADIHVISLDGWERVYDLDGVGLFYPSWRPPIDR